jgi:surfeit locus 1 family protein
VAAARISVRTVVAVAGLLAFAGLFAALGAWQLRRAHENRALEAQFEAGANGAPLRELPTVLTDANRFRRVEVRGVFLAEPQFLLDNMLHDGMAGYQVLTLLRVEGTRRRLVVNRGWVAGGLDRSVLPEVGAPTDSRTLVGRIERLPRPGLRLGAASAPSAGPAGSVAVVQYPTMDELAARVGEPLFEYQLLLDPDQPDGYVRDWRAPGISPERNLIYAGQWWLLAAGALGAALTIAYRSSRRRS